VSEGPRRLLFAITVYNGRDVVPDCLRSAAAMAPETVDVDVLVLDDASPAPGFSGEIEALCAELKVGYYRTPRNLGIPRNVNLGLLRALEGGYDYVVIANSDILMPNLLCDHLVEIADSDERISSVTAWSNNVSIYSLPNGAPDRFLADQERVNWVSSSIYGQFGDAAVDVPVGISFCILIPVPLLRHVGLMDPVFGRGYCEETDWSLRAQSLGYRVCLGPSAFVYHRGQGSTSEAGVLPAGHTTVPENERIIDLRYPLFRSQVDAFIRSEILEVLVADARRKLLVDAAREWGYDVELGWSPEPSPEWGEITVALEPDHKGRPVPVARFIGFAQRIPVIDDDITTSIIEYFSRKPASVRTVGPEKPLHDLAEAFASLGSGVVHEIGYPARV